MISDAHRGLVDAIGATLPGAGGRDVARITREPDVAQPSRRGWVIAMLHPVYDQPDADAVHRSTPG